MLVPEFYVIGTPRTADALACAHRRGWTTGLDRGGLPPTGGLLNGMVPITHPDSLVTVLIARRNEPAELIGVRQEGLSGACYVELVPDVDRAQDWPKVRELLDEIDAHVPGHEDARWSRQITGEIVLDGPEILPRPEGF